MATLKRSDYEKWNEQAKNGFKFDVRRYVLWSEKQLVKYVEQPDGSEIEYTLCYAAEHDPACSWRTTGRQIPTLSIQRLTPSGSGCYIGGRPDIYEVGAPETSKKYKTLCDLSGTLDLAQYAVDHLKSGAYSLF